VARIYPDSTQLLDWHYLYRRHLAGETARPDLLVVGFSQLGLHDTPADADQIGRIARNATTLRDAPELFIHDLHTLSQRAEYLLADTSVGFAIRERIRLRLFDLLIPSFRPTQRALNEAQREIAAASGAADTAPPSYKTLQRFLQLVDTQAVEVVFVAMPLRAPYALDPRLPSIINRAGAHLVDLRAVPGLTPRRSATTCTWRLRVRRSIAARWPTYCCPSWCPARTLASAQLRKCRGHLHVATDDLERAAPGEALQ
jgi:hypothetical protein